MIEALRIELAQTNAKLMKMEQDQTIFLYQHQELMNENEKLRHKNEVLKYENDELQQENLTMRSNISASLNKVMISMSPGRSNIVDIGCWLTKINKEITKIRYVFVTFL